MKSKLDKYSICELQQLLDTSVSYSDVLRKINMKPLCGNRDTLKNRIKLHNLSIDQLNINRSTKRATDMKTRNLNKKDYSTDLCENSQLNSKGLKKWIRDNSLLKYECVECGITDTYNDKPITLQLDHINGINDDNMLENLRFLCANCHSQTSTFSGRNLTTNKKCIDCGSSISNKSIRCASCAQIEINKHKSKRPDKDTLISNLCTYNYTKVGQMYNVSDNAVRKWCMFYELPLKRKDILKMAGATGNDPATSGSTDQCSTN